MKEDFNQVLQFCEEKNLYVGEGNPDAKILLIGKEPGFSQEDKIKYKEQLKTIEGIKSIAIESAKNNLYRLQNDYQTTFLPKLKEDIKRSPTWLNYQRLIDKIKILSGEETGTTKWHFLDDSFVTDLNQIRLPDSNYLTRSKLDNSIKIESIKERERIFEYDFFKKPIILLASLHYPTLEFNKKKYNYYKFDIEKIFDVSFIETEKVGNDWINIHYNSDWETIGKKRTLIHTRQFSRFYNKNGAKLLLDRIADITYEFYKN